MPLPEFRLQIRGIWRVVAEMETLRIDDPHMDHERAAVLLWRVIKDLDVARYNGRPVRSKIVGGTKTLHHLLPNLVFPVDREYTRTFFGSPDFENRQEESFKFIFRSGVEIARAVALEKYVGEGWNSSISKVLDNGIVGFCLAEGLMSRNKESEREKRAILKAIRAALKEMGLENIEGDRLTQVLMENGELMRRMNAKLAK